VLALVKENLNQAEDEIDRRRFLLASEAENQGRSAKAMMRRMQRGAAQSE
jgi:hypothetical protein